MTSPVSQIACTLPRKTSASTESLARSRARRAGSFSACHSAFRYRYPKSGRFIASTKPISFSVVEVPWATAAPFGIRSRSSASAATRSFTNVQETPRASSAASVRSTRPRSSTVRPSAPVSMRSRSRGLAGGPNSRGARLRAALEMEQPPLPREPSREPAEPVRRDDAVARDHDARGVLPQGVADGPRRAGLPDRPRDVAVRPHLARRDPSGRRVHLPLELRVPGEVHVVPAEVHGLAGEVAGEVPRDGGAHRLRPAAGTEVDLLHDAAVGLDRHGPDGGLEDLLHGHRGGEANGTYLPCAFEGRSAPPENAWTSSTRSPSFSGRDRTPSTNISSLIATFTRESWPSRLFRSSGNCRPRWSRSAPTSCTSSPTVTAPSGRSTIARGMRTVTLNPKTIRFSSSRHASVGMPSASSPQGRGER